MNAILPGRPYPLGANWDGEGVNFAIFSEKAERIDLCFFAGPGAESEQSRVILREVRGRVWHAYVRGVGPGQLYGYRVHGPFDPEKGLRFNPSKLLLDPYTQAVSGCVNWDAPVFGYPVGKADDLTRDEGDSAWGALRSVVVDPSFDWEGDSLLGTPWHRTIIYEAHVKGATIRHPGVPEGRRGTYAGLASPPMIEHFRKLGITAVELMPVHEFLDDKVLIDKGLRNYWGYNTIAFFAPTSRYSGSGENGEQVVEFKSMVKAFHKAGIEVILDVVYNHTAEGNHLGPTLCYRGIDNTTYYRLVEDKPRYYMDYTGTGNSPNMRHPQVQKLIMDSLRYWVLDMHVDGFRFDLASTLARELHDVDRLSAFFDIIHQDPILSRVKLIAEPWDVGDGGYQVGNFPYLWTEWNGKYRDAVRKFWRGDEGQSSETAYRLSGSSDLYEMNGRRPTASINFVTAHDGFTLHDLVSYSRKHNEANGEGNRDGADEISCEVAGPEGPSDDPSVLDLRERMKRNLMATLAFSQGVPMLCGGDELQRTQNGNNNAYCQDNEISWYNWTLDDRKTAFLEIVSRLLALRRDHPALRRPKFFQGRPIRGAEIKDIMWVRVDGREMTDQDWGSWIRCFGMLLAGEIPDLQDEKGEPVRDDSLLVVMNSDPNPVGFTLPLEDFVWEVLFETARGAPDPDGAPMRSGAQVEIPGRSVWLMRMMKEVPGPI